MEVIKINTFDGSTFEGFKIAHQKELPKSAVLHVCTYDENFNNYNIYLSFNKRGNKTYILRTKI